MYSYSTKELIFSFDEEKGRICSLCYKGKEYIGAELPLFVVGLRDEKGVLTRKNTYEMRLSEFRKTDDGFEFRYESGDLSVSGSVRVGEEIDWGISVSRLEGYAVEWVNYPQIGVPDDFADRGGSSKILWGFNEGTLIEDITAREKSWWGYFEPEYPCLGLMGVYPAGVETQFMAYYNDRSGLYFASHDKDDYLKGINFLRENGGVKLEFRHFGGGNVGDGYEMKYPMVVQFFEGDWQDAAELYRSWFQSLKKPEYVPIPQNPKLPAWYGESPVVVTYPVRGKHDTDVMNPNKLFPYINVMPHVERLEKVFGSRIMVLLMHWEGTAPWAPPIVWPPYGGEEALKELIDALHRRGDVVGVYCSGIGWTTESHVAEYNTKKFFDEHNLKEEMCLSPEQTLPYSRICTAQRAGYDMCPTREFTVRTLKGQVEKMAGAGLDYVQLMDQNHGGTSFFCYSKKHNHPNIPGKWQVDAVREMYRTVQENADKTLFGCESAAAQSYIPYLLFSDNRFNLTYGLGRPVPMYAYVYHEYLNNFLGNQVCADCFVDMEKCPESFFERMAYAFLAGDMLTVVINENGEIDWNWGKFNKEKKPPEQEPIERFIRNLNGWRTGRGKDYLHTGRMVKPFRVDCESYRIIRRDGSSISVPRIPTSAWVSGKGSYAQFLANYSDVARKCTVRTDRPCALWTGGFAAPVSLPVGENEITVEALSAVMIEAPADGKSDT